VDKKYNYNLFICPFLYHFDIQNRTQKSKSVSKNQQYPRITDDNNKSPNFNIYGFMGISQ